MWYATMKTVKNVALGEASDTALQQCLLHQFPSWLSRLPFCSCLQVGFIFGLSFLLLRLAFALISQFMVTLTFEEWMST